jgi:hypothetical protein
MASAQRHRGRSSAVEEETADTSKMLAHTYKTVWCHIPDSTSPKNLKIFKTNNFTFIIVICIHSKNIQKR